MADYKAIMGLVEEVQDILDLQEKKKPAKDDHDWSHHPDDEDDGSGGPDSAAHKKHSRRKSARKHNPFKWVKKGKAIGKGPGGKFRKRTVAKTGDWKCHCVNYKCLCKGKDPETGKRVSKKVRIKKNYKKTYNAKYRKWRKTKGKRFGPGGGIFKARPKAS